MKLKFKIWLESADWLQDHLPKPMVSVDGFGWKIHLTTGMDDNVRSRAYQLVQQLIRINGGKWKSKMLHGGDPGSKDITIYCGTRQEANKAALAIIADRELKSLLAHPSVEVLEDDIELVPNTGIYGRFDAENLKTTYGEFTKSGCTGWSGLKDDVGQMIWNKTFDRKMACQKAYNALAKTFGRAFTG